MSPITFSNMSGYQLGGRLKGHTDAIHTLAIANSGKWLASGGSDGVKLWDLTTHAQLRFTYPVHGLRGPISCMTWVRRDIAREILCYGTGLSWLVSCGQSLREGNLEECWARRLGQGFEITCICRNETSGCGATGTCDSIVQVWTFESNGGYIHFSRTLGFVNNTAQDLYLFGLYNGQWHILQGDDGKVLSSRDTDRMMGATAISVEQNQFVVDNGTDGFDLHALDNSMHVRTLPMEIPTKKLPKQVAFGENSQVIVGGSDHGVVYVFERESGKLLHSL
ncbi:WD40 repeat-like protein [Ramaria rubella]|nr:WD40 repeat-like protein [Ramaria rubella]